MGNSKGGFVTIDNYEKQEQLDKLFREQIRRLSDKTLAERLTQNLTNDTMIYLLIEANRRKDTVIHELNRRITRLEEKNLTKRGRKRQTYFYNGKELTDEYLLELVDYEFYDSISKLEELVGAKKNVLRSRFKRAKNKQKIARGLENNGDC